MARFNARQKDKNVVIAKRSRLSNQHPFGNGGRLLRLARPYQLTKQVRSLDRKHMILVDAMTNFEPVTMKHIRRYRYLEKRDFTGANTPWLKASIVVGTNRPRDVFTHEIASRYARSKGQVVIRWQKKYGLWEQKPGPKFAARLLRDDPSLYEYLVIKSRGYVTKPLIPKWNVVNGTPFEYHSIGFATEEDENEFKTQLKKCQTGGYYHADQAPSLH